MEDFTLRVLIAAAFISIAIEGFVYIYFYKPFLKQLNFINLVGTADADHRSTAWIEGVAILVAVLVSSNV